MILCRPRRPKAHKADKETHPHSRPFGGACVACGHICVFVLAVAFPDLPRKWLVFIYGCPVSFTVTTVFSCLWWRTASRIISITGMIWTLAASVDITLKIPNMFLIYAVAAVLQILVFLWFWLISDRHRAGK